MTRERQQLGEGEVRVGDAVGHPVRARTAQQQLDDRGGVDDDHRGSRSARTAAADSPPVLFSRAATRARSS
jgi:hypothetical protein